VLQGLLSFDECLEEVALPNYFMLDTKVARSDKILEFTFETMQEYGSIKRQLLELMYLCVHNSQRVSTDRSLLESAILDELLAGSDGSQQLNSDIQSAPFDYLRQVCFLPASEPSTEYGEEEIVAIGKELGQAYKSMQA